MNRNHWTNVLWYLLAYPLLMLSIATPLNILTIHLMMVPALMMLRNFALPQFIAVYGVGLALVILLAGGTGIVLAALSLFLLPPVIAMNAGYKKFGSAKAALLAGSGALLAELVLALLISQAAGLQPVQSFQESVRASVDALPGEWQNYFTEEMLETSLNFFVQILPLLMILTSVYLVVLTHGVGRWLLNKTGDRVPGLPPMRTWKLPKSMVWYYIVAMLLDFILPVDPDSFLTTVLMNLLPLLTICFAVQALSFLFFIAHAKARGRALPILAVVATVLFPPLLYPLSLLGLFDAVFPIRERMADK